MQQRRFVLVLLTCFAFSAAPATAEDGASWRSEPAFKSMMKAEAKTLTKLMNSAVKEEYRRQAFYLATRVLQANPESMAAGEVIETLTDEMLLGGKEPKKSWIKKRDKVLRGLGDRWFNFGETLEAAGMDPVKYYAVNQRAQAYGSTAGPLMTALEQAGYVWLHTLLDRPAEDVFKLVPRERYRELTFPPEYDDAFLKYRTRWPEATAVTWGRWRLVSGAPWETTLKHIDLIARTEQFTAATFGKIQKPDPEAMQDFVLFPDIDVYGGIGGSYVDKRWKEMFEPTSSWFERRRRRLLFSAKHRDNPWVSAESRIQGRVGHILARTAFGKSAGGRIRGRGMWLFRGLRGAFQGLARENNGAGFVLDPNLCWQLTAARALRDSGQLLDWETFFSLDDAAAREVPKVTVTWKRDGVTREAKEVDVVSVQATAFVVGVWQSKAGPRGIRTLLEALVKRDSLPDVDKALKWRKGTAIKEASRAMDAITLDTD